jgi:Winged helix DNA-binding domain
VTISAGPPVAMVSSRVRPARVCTAYPPALLVYWPTALVLAYALIAAFYIRRSQARGVGTRVRPYVVAGIILALAMTGSLLWTLYHPLAFTLAAPGLFSAPHSYPFAIGLALVVLSGAERNGALLDLALGYLAVVLVTATVGSVTAGNLSQHLGVLETAGLIALEKGYAGKRARTWVTLTKAGQAALEAEIAQLKLLISRIHPAPSL